MKRVLLVLLTLVSFAASAQLDTVTFGWSPSATPGISENRLYFSKSTNEWTHVKVLGPLATNATVNLTESGRWYFIATVRSPEGLESLPSNVVAYDVSAAPTASSGLKVLSAIVTRVSTVVTSTNLVTVP